MAVAILWANRIMNGDNSYSEVPKGLKPKVKTILEEAGCGYLVTE